MAKRFKSIVILDNQALFLFLLHEKLSEYFPEYKVVKFNNCEDTFKYVKRNKTALILFNIEMKFNSGRLFVDEVSNTFYDIKTLAISERNHKEHVYLSQFYEINGFVTKNVDFDSLIDSINVVVNSDLFICMEWFELNNKLYREKVQLLIEQLRTLTKREKETLLLYLDGYNTLEVSTSMGVGVKSVENYKNRIVNKLQPLEISRFSAWVYQNAPLLKLLVSRKKM